MVLTHRMSAVLEEMLEVAQHGLGVARIGVAEDPGAILGHEARHRVEARIGTQLREHLYGLGMQQPAHALHELIEVQGVSALHGAQLYDAILNVSFDGATGPISFNRNPAGQAFRGDRQVGARYEVRNFNLRP